MTTLLLRSLLAASACVKCARVGSDVVLWRTDGAGLVPYHAECLTGRPLDGAAARIDLALAEEGAP